MRPLRIFSTSDDGQNPLGPTVLHWSFKRGELAAMTWEALKDWPAQHARTGAFRNGSERGSHTGDKVVAKAIAYRLIHALRIQARNGKIVGIGKQTGGRGSG